MKKFHKKLSSLLLGAALAFTTIVTPALAADSSVTYEGRAEKFVYAPGSEQSDTDLFDNFKNVMPGDSLEQIIYVANNNKKCDYVKIHLRAEAHGEENPLIDAVANKEDVASMSDFLNQLGMKVYLKDEVIYESSPDEVAGFKEGVLIGALRYGAVAELKVVLEVPLELDNKYANRIGEVDWIFTVSEHNDSKGGGGGSKPKPKPTPEPEVNHDIIVIEPEEIPLGDIPFDVLGALDIPKTGDETMIWPYLLLFVAGVLGLGVTVLKKSKRG